MSKTESILDITIIIPFKDKSELTLSCVDSILKYGPSVKEILLVSNNSSNAELQRIADHTKSYPHIRLIEYNQPFNYQKMNNWAVRRTHTKFIMFLNNDTELRSSSTVLIEKMYIKAHEKNVGITGCLLLYGDERTIQHAGVFLLPNGLADHVYAGKKYRDAIAQQDTKVFPYDIQKEHPMTAVTGAVNIIERSKFDAVKGFDERFIICGGDVDLCIRLNKKGYQTWYVAGGYILHKESQSRSQKPVPYSDFYWSYLSYVSAYDFKAGDPFLPKITKNNN